MDRWSPTVWLIVIVPASACALLGLAWLVSWLARGQRTGGLIRLAGTELSAEHDLGMLSSFDEAGFRARLTDVYQHVCSAWSEHRVADLKEDVTIDLLAAWTEQLKGAPIPLMLPLWAVTAKIVEAGVLAGYQRLTVRLDGGGWHGQPSLQFWTFERGSVGALGGRTCPGCGAPLALDQRGRCTSCGATIDLGRLAWMLARIESAMDWSERELAQDQSTIEKLDAIVAADPAFEPEVFTDRVMALYPQLARAIEDPTSPLAQVAIAPRLRRGLETMRIVHERLGRTVVIEPVSVTGLMVAAARHDTSGDSITVDITGVSARYQVDRTGLVVQGDKQPSRIVDRWTFTREAGVSTSSHGGVLAEKCSTCGAPIDINDHGRCVHCGAEVTLGNQDWVLSGISTYEDPVAAENVSDVEDDRREPCAD